MKQELPALRPSSLPLARALRIARIPLALAVIVYVIAAAYMGIYQRSFLYKPAPAWIPPDASVLPRAEAFDLSGSDGVALRGWRIAPTRPDALTYLYFHGNANGLDRRATRFGAMTADGSGLIALSYRGYGGSGGKPTEASLHADAEAIFREISKTVPPERIVLVGESLGTGVALNLATKVKPKAVLLDSPYYSVLHRAQAQYPWLPVSLLLADTFRSDQWIARVKAPVMIWHGTADTVIPPEDSAKLAAGAKPGTLTRKLYPGERHVVPYDRGPDRDVPVFLAGTGL